VIALNVRPILADKVAAHPIYDHVFPVLAVAVWVILAQWVPPQESARQWIYGSVATVSGLALAASTFACTMTYQSSNILMTQVRKMFTKELRRNWMAILRSALLTALLPLIALAIDSTNSAAATGVTLYAVFLLIARFLRSIFWLSYTLFMSETSESIPERREVSLRSGL
jgi:hypothetical protein